MIEKGTEKPIKTVTKDHEKQTVHAKERERERPEDRKRYSGVYLEKRTVCDRFQGGIKQEFLPFGYKGGSLSLWVCV